MPNLLLTQVWLEVIHSEEAAADLRLTQVRLQVMTPTEQAIPATNAFISCFEIFPAAENGGDGVCVPYAYAWTPQGVVSWDINFDGTLHGDTLIQPESGIATLICDFNVSRHLENPEGKKWTLTGVYRNSSNSKVGLALLTMLDGEDGDYYEFTLDNALTSKPFHLNLTSLYIVEVRSVFITDPQVNVGDPLPNTENWIECIRIEKNDFGAEAEATVIYDE